MGYQPQAPLLGAGEPVRRADRLVKALFDSIAAEPAPDHLLGLVRELDARSRAA